MSLSTPLCRSWLPPVFGFITCSALLALTCSTASAQDVAAQLGRVTSSLANEKHTLVYKFKPGETMYYEVVDQSAVKTKVKGNTETVKSQAKSLKKWEITEVAPSGQSKFVYSLDFMNMYSEMSGRQAQHYDSRTDKAPPPEYEGISETLGKPISTVTVSPTGEILKRENNVKQVDRGTGGLLMPLPEGPIAIGGEWQVPDSVSIRHKDGRYQEIKTRQLYRLEKVAAGVATISLATQVLTPATKPEVKSQLVQKLSKGEIKFDIDAGRMISKQLDWDEVIIGFSGPESSMSFLARMVERLVPPTEVAALREPPTTR